MAIAVRPVGVRQPGVDRGLLRLAVRLVRRGALVLAGSVAGYLALEVASYRIAYPDALSRERLAMFDTPAVRMLQGPPLAVGNAGGFTVWDAGYVLEIIVGVWAVLAATRLLRGEEESQRAELVLAGRAGATRLAAVQLLVLGAASALVGLASTAAMVAMGTGGRGSVLLGVALGGFTATMAALGAVMAQVHRERRPAVMYASAALAAAYVVRVLANSTDDRAWLRWLTPFGWFDLVNAYGDPRYLALLPLLLAPAVLGLLALRLRALRDLGAGLVAGSDSREPDLHLLSGPVALGWRTSRGVLLGWLAGLGGYAFFIGALLSSVLDFLNRDESTRRMMAQLGMDLTHADSYVGLMASIYGVGLGLYACWRIGAVRAEEDSARLDNVLVRPVTRTRWLAGQLALTGLMTVLLAAGIGLLQWLGGRTTGADITLGGSMAALLNTLPVAAVAAGLATVLLGLAPRLTVGVSVSFTVAAYLLALLGPALDWPGWVVGLSPFHHLAAVPAVAFDPVSTVVLTLIGVALAVVGLIEFLRRDLVGA
jgi:ABC-2 type transport system permease protein